MDFIFIFNHRWAVQNFRLIEQKLHLMVICPMLNNALLSILLFL